MIGNPPYTYRNAIEIEEKEFYKKEYRSIEGNFDLYKIFMERTILLTKESGYTSFIVPNTFLSAISYKKLRLLILDNFRIIELFDLGLDIFENVVVESVIFSFKKEKTNSNKNVIVKRQRDRKREFEDLEASYLIDIDKYAGSDCTFNINISDEYSGIIDKMIYGSLELGEICYCTVGINTGYIKDDLTSDAKIDVRYHKMLNGKDIGRYTVSWPGQYIMYDHEFVKSKGDRGRALPPEYIFTSSKILVQRTRRGMKRKLVCTLDTEKHYNLNRLSNIVITNNDYRIEDLLSLLNSKLLDFYFNVFFNEYEVKPIHLSQLPIPKSIRGNTQLGDLGNEMILLNQQIDSKSREFINFFQLNYSFSSISKKLQKWYELDFGDFNKEFNKAIKNSGFNMLSKKDEMEWMEVFEIKRSEVQKLKDEAEKTDQEIDQLVYELYRLTEKEIETINNF